MYICLMVTAMIVVPSVHVPSCRTVRLHTRRALGSLRHGRALVSSSHWVTNLVRSLGRITTRRCLQLVSLRGCLVSSRWGVVGSLVSPLVHLLVRVVVAEILRGRRRGRGQQRSRPCRCGRYMTRSWFFGASYFPRLLVVISAHFSR